MYSPFVDVTIVLVWRVLSRSRHPLWLSTCQQWHSEGGLGCSNPPPPKFRRPSKIVPNSTWFEKTVKNCWI